MRIGFACIYLDDQKQTPEKLKLSRVSVSRFTSLKRREREQVLLELAVRNVKSIYRLVKRVAAGPKILRMVRLGSDILPIYTHDSALPLYLNPDLGILKAIKPIFAKIGDLARSERVRLSFHPGQFTILNNPSLTDGIHEIEYHSRMADWMGYTGWHPQGFCINIHGGGKTNGLDHFRDNFKRLSQTARNLLTVENDEFSYGPKQLVEELGDLLPIVLDVHHYWIYRGRWLEPDHASLSEVIDTWRGIRPKMHLAQSHPTLIDKGMPELERALKRHNKSQLRQHSDAMWNQAINRYALRFLDRFDIMCECKHKNQGLIPLYEQWRKSRDEG